MTKGEDYINGLKRALEIVLEEVKPSAPQYYQDAVNVLSSRIDREIEACNPSITTTAPSPIIRRGGPFTDGE